MEVVHKVIWWPAHPPPAPERGIQIAKRAHGKGSLTARDAGDMGVHGQDGGALYVGQELQRRRGRGRGHGPGHRVVHEPRGGAHVQPPARGGASQPRRCTSSQRSGQWALCCCGGDRVSNNGTCRRCCTCLLEWQLQGCRLQLAEDEGGAAPGGAMLPAVRWRLLHQATTSPRSPQASAHRNACTVWPSWSPHLLSTRLPLRLLTFFSLALRHGMS